VRPVDRESEPAVALAAGTWHARRGKAGLEANLRRAGMREEGFWQQYGSWVSAMRGDYPGALLDRVRDYATPGGTVLDIGAGTGVFALPLARSARSVTAVEPSPAQVSQLREAIARERTSNIAILEQRWEDVDAETLGGHDLVMAVHSLQMEDIVAALRKMCRVAVRCLLLVHPARSSLSSLLHDLFGIEPGPDYSPLDAILGGLGYRPAVEFVEYSYDVPLDLQLDMLRYNPGLDAGQCNEFRDFAVGHDMIAPRDGVPWMSRTVTDALVSVVSG